MPWREGDFFIASLGDDELLKLESDVATEKAKRGINSAALPRGMYLVGTVLDAGSYSISPVLSEGESSYQIGVYESADTIKSEGTLFELSLYDGDSFVVALADNNILAVEGTCIISPFKVVFDGDSSNS